MKHITLSLLFAFSSLAFAWQDPDYAAIASYKRGDSRAAMRVVEENIRPGPGEVSRFSKISLGACKLRNSNRRTTIISNSEFVVSR